MVNRFVQFLEILFPPRASQLLISSSTKKPIPYQAVCTNETWSLSEYHNQLVKAAILENKFHANKSAAVLLAQLLHRFIIEKQLTEALFIPIPLSKKRLRQRGHNQTTTFLAQLPIHISISENLLVRVADTTPQMKLPRAQRLTNIKDAFAVNLNKVSLLQQFTTIVLVDDVVTTGTTLNEAKATLQQHFPTTQIMCVAIAH